jgi:putative phage-type endonuclease
MTGTAEWLERRRNGIGGSDVAAILGLSPYAGPFDVWMEKLGKREADEGETEGEKKQKNRGNVLEPAVANWYAAELDCAVAAIPQAMLPLRGEASWMTGSPDRMAIPSTLWDLSIEEVLESNEAWGMEAKTARSLDGWGESGTDIIPVYYMTQCVWYMAITKKARWDLAVYFPFYDDFRWYTIKRDLSTENAIVKRVTEWRERHIVGQEMPEIDGSEGAAKYLIDTYRVPRLPDRDATSEEVSLALELRDVRRTLDSAKERYELLSTQMKASIGEYRGVRHPDFGSILWSPVAGRATAKMKDLEKKHPAIYEQLLGEGIINIGKPSRQFRPSFGKEE